MCGLIPALVESVYLDSVVSVFLQDLLSVFVRIERVHEHQWNISIICFIQVLQRPKRKDYIKPLSSKLTHVLSMNIQTSQQFPQCFSLILILWQVYYIPLQFCFIWENELQIILNNKSYCLDNNTVNVRSLTQEPS